MRTQRVVIQFTFAHGVRHRAAVVAGRDGHGELRNIAPAQDEEVSVRRRRGEDSQDHLSSCAPEGKGTRVEEEAEA